MEMKRPIRKKLRKHERPRLRYLLFSKEDGERAKKTLKDLGVYYKEMELVVKSLMEKQLDRIILRVNKNDMKKIKKITEENKIKPLNVSGTLKGLLD
jgi:hypothetical protein